MAEDEATRAAIGALLGRPRALTRHGGLRLQRCARVARQRAETLETSATGERLLGEFAADFTDAAAIIRGHPESMQLLQQAEAVGGSYEGFSEEDPIAPHHRAFTRGTRVWIPRAHQADPERAVSAFLFELTNVISKRQHDAVEQAAMEGTISCDQCAHETVAIEVDGAIRRAEIWASRRASITDEAERARLDELYYYPVYLDLQAGRRTREQIIETALDAIVPGTGQTHRERYRDQCLSHQESYWRRQSAGRRMW
jgi:hypothetical protein